LKGDIFVKLLKLVLNQNSAQAKWLGHCFGLVPVKHLK